MRFRRLILSLSSGRRKGSLLCRIHFTKSVHATEHCIISFIYFSYRVSLLISHSFCLFSFSLSDLLCLFLFLISFFLSPFCPFLLQPFCSLFLLLVLRLSISLRFYISLLQSFSLLLLSSFCEAVQLFMYNASSSRIYLLISTYIITNLKYIWIKLTIPMWKYTCLRLPAKR
jgi:hypothetical protein